METSVNTVRVELPFDWEGLLDFLRPRAIAGVEAVVDGELRRSLRLSGTAGTIGIQFTNRRLSLQMHGIEQFLAQSGAVLDLARKVLDLDHQADARRERFAADSVLAPLSARWPGIRLPGAWDGFEMGVRAILGQQVTVKAAHTLAGRVAQKYGSPLRSNYKQVTTLFPEASSVAAAPIEDLAALGLTRKRAETIHHFAIWWEGGQAGKLIDLPGIGPWTDHYIRMRGNSEADAFPAADLGIHKALGLHGLGTAKATRQAEQLSLAWQPWRAYAVILLWRSLGTVAEPK